MGVFRDHIYPVIAGVVAGMAGGLLGLEWLWISILIAIPLAILSPNSIKAGALNSLIASAAVFLTPLILSISTDPRAMRMIDTLSSITGVSGAALIAIPLTVYVLVSVLASMAIISMKRIAVGLREGQPG